MPDYTLIDSTLESYLEASIAELSKLCAQPSISAQNLGLAEGGVDYAVDEFNQALLPQNSTPTCRNSAMALA